MPFLSQPLPTQRFRFQLNLQSTNLTGERYGIDELELSAQGGFLGLRSLRRIKHPLIRSLGNIVAAIHTGPGAK